MRATPISRLFCYTSTTQAGLAGRQNNFEGASMLAKFRSTIRSLSFPTWSIPIALLVLALLSYGLRAASLGFYWDDWPNVWYFHRFGAEGITRAFEGDRPFLSLIYNLSLPLLNHSAQAWQVFALLTHWAYGVGFWWMLALTWPKQKHKAAWAAALLIVYPGFSQHWIAIVYGQAFILFAAQFFSMGLMLWLLRQRRRISRVWLITGTLLSMLLSAFNMFSSEYFFGLELLRPILIWMVLSQEETAAEPNKALSGRWAGWRERAGRVALWWAPYLVLVIAFIIWRGFIHTFPGRPMTTLSGLEQSPLTALANLAVAILHDLLVASLAAWGQPLQQLNGLFDTSGLINGLELLGLIVITALLASLYLGRLRAPSSLGADPLDAEERVPTTRSGWLGHWGAQACALGFFAMLISGWPFWITGLPMRMGFPQDRYSLPLSVGVSLLLAGLIDGFGKNFTRKILLLSLALGLAAGFHFNTSLAYRQEWTLVRDFFWQFTWRAPSIQPGTLLLSDSMPFQYDEDDSLNAPFNWTYDPNGHSDQVQYYLADILVRVHSLPNLAPNTPVTREFRGTQFAGSTDRAILFYYPPSGSGCLHILDPEYDSDAYRLPDRIQRAISISNPKALIQNSETPAAPPVDVFGSEPKHRWCYYYQKAELARQNQNWPEIVQLGKESIGVGYHPEDSAEYLPFIEGYTQSALWDDALQLTRSALYEAPSARPGLCAVWKRGYQKFPDLPTRYPDEIESLLSCKIR